VAIVGIEVLEERTAFNIRETRIGELGKTLAVKNGVFWDVTPCGS
jgi:hypothetical protein